MPSTSLNKRRPSTAGSSNDSDHGDSRARSEVAVMRPIVVAARAAGLAREA